MITDESSNWALVGSILGPVIAGSCGYFRIEVEDVSAGETYVLSVRRKRYTVAQRVLKLNDAIENLNFIAEL